MRVRGRCSPILNKLKMSTSLLSSNAGIELLFSPFYYSVRTLDPTFSFYISWLEVKKWIIGRNMLEVGDQLQKIRKRTCNFYCWETDQRMIRDLTWLDWSVVLESPIWQSAEPFIQTAGSSKCVRRSMSWRTRASVFVLGPLKILLRVYKGSLLDPASVCPLRKDPAVTQFLFLKSL